MNKLKPEVNEALDQQRLNHRLNVGASWFYWIAGLTFVSSIIALIGKQPFGFIIGLGITQIADTLGNNILMTLSFDTLLAGLFLFLGHRARQAKVWAFHLGILLYGLDSLVFLSVKDYVGLMFHVFVILGLLGGLQAIYQKQTLIPADSNSYTI